MTYLGIVVTLTLVVLIFMALQISTLVSLLRALYIEMKPSVEALATAETQCGNDTFADKVLLKMHDLDRQKFMLKQINETLDEIKDFNQLSPGQKDKINALKDSLEQIREASPPPSPAT